MPSFTTFCSECWDKFNTSAPVVHSFKRKFLQHCNKNSCLEKLLGKKVWQTSISVGKQRQYLHQVTSWGPWRLSRQEEAKRVPTCTLFGQSSWGDHRIWRSLQSPYELNSWEMRKRHLACSCTTTFKNPGLNRNLTKICI